jgi:hypothetical protein
MKKYFFIFAYIITLAVLFSSCATLIGPKTNTLSLSSNPPNANVYINGANLGTTPLKLDLIPNKTYTIEYKKEGFKTVTRTVSSQVNIGWIVLDFFVGFFMSIIIDAITGDWKSLDQNSVNVELIKQNN